MSGVFLSQVILVLGSFVLTRIFTPEDFGLIALFLSLASVLTVISTGRYEHSIILPKERSDGYNLMLQTVFIVIAFSVVLFFVLWPLADKLSVLLRNPAIAPWLPFLPLMVLCNALFFTFRAWLIRFKEFKTITTAGVVKSIVLNGILITGGFITGHVVFFLIGNITAQSIETLLLYRRMRKQGISEKRYDKQQVIELFRRYDNFPKYLLPADLINTYASQNPIILLNLFFGDAVVGFYSLAERVLGLPIKLISSTTKEVYKQKATAEFNSKGNCRQVFRNTFLMLFFSSLIPTVILFFAAPDLFAFFFGEEWRSSGVYSRYLLIMFCFQFSVSPLSFTLFIRGHQRYNLYWQIGLLITTSAGLYFGYYHGSADYAILGFSVMYSIMYLVYLKMIHNAAK